jgi:hypothetical protein
MAETQKCSSILRRVVTSNVKGDYSTWMRGRPVKFIVPDMDTSMMFRDSMLGSGRLLDLHHQPRNDESLRAEQLDGLYSSVDGLGSLGLLAAAAI